MRNIWFVAAIVLGIALVCSNAWWFYQSLDTATVLKATEQQYRDNCGAFKQVAALAPALSHGAKRSEIVSIAREAADDSQAFEKYGLTWVRGIGLRFESDGSLAEILPAWDPFECW